MNMLGEHDNYVAAFDGAFMSIPDMQYSLALFPENTPAHALADRLGGWKSKRVSYSVVISILSPKPLAKIINDNDYYIHVLEYLWNHQENMQIYFRTDRGVFPGEYYKKILPDLVIQQKPVCC